MVTLTENAAAKVKEILAQQGKNGYALRLFVRGGGCAGLEYGLAFDEAREKDIVHENFGIRVLVDPRSAMYVDGAEIDYVDNLLGGGFKINNPNATSTCGCGHSFKA